MIQDIYDPLNEYINVFRDRFIEVSKNTFDSLASEACVDIEANRKTCKEIYSKEKELSRTKTSLCWWRILCVVLWIGALASIVLSICMGYSTQTIIILCSSALISIVFLFVKVHPKIKQLKKQRDTLNQRITALRDIAWKQMESLNRLYDWDILTRMMTKTVPRLEFDPYFTTQRLADLKKSYGWDDSFNEGRSVLYSHSGLINGNPFVLCRTRKMEMGTKTYSNSITVPYTTTERDANGRVQTVTRYETLTATVVKPYPGYYEKTRLIYGNTAAPDLVFSRVKSGLASKEGSLAFNMKKNSLKRKSRKLTKNDFAMMTNEEFEVAFNTSNRNNNQQFALLFTPLAMESMLALLKDNTSAYGDDFDFYKNRMINTIVPDHIQTLDLELSPETYRNFDFDKAKEDFTRTNSDLFRAIYFSLAPLLCVPMYQQIRPLSDIYGKDMMPQSAFWEHEALANFWGQEKFQHPNCVTKSILKTVQNGSNIDVYAYGYRIEKRVENVTKWGRDGRLHTIPVQWDEYIPVTGHGSIAMYEDNNEDKAQSQSERMDNINSFLTQNQARIYRRHIASKIV